MRVKQTGKMLSRNLLTFATIVSSLSVVVGASVDLDSGDYEVLADNDGKSNDNGNGLHFRWMISWESRKGGNGVRRGPRRPRERGYTWVAPDTGTKSVGIMESTFCRPRD